jgi:ATP-binding cassette subfamily C (CFTR/MRP) protein 1
MGTQEKYFEETIDKLRHKELRAVFGEQIIGIVFMAITAAAPIIGAVVAIVLYVSGGGKIDVAVVFTIVAAFRQLESPLLQLPQDIQGAIKYNVSSNRVGPFLNSLSSADSQSAKPRPVVSSLNAIEIEDADLYWGLPPPPEQDDNKSTNNKAKADKSETWTKADRDAGDTVIILPEEATDDDKAPQKTEQQQQQQQQYVPALLGTTVTIQKGKITAIVGPVGSGKSAMCSAILGDMTVRKGRVSIAGELAYAPQSPWMVNATIRDNILFGEEYDAVRYRRVLQVCQLRHDLAVLQAGDKTMIGERGITLSGGQRSRISTARAAYSRRDIALLDDPLSALDPAVANKLFRECICDFMRGRTVVLVTNQLNFLPSCESVILLGLTSDVVEHGATDTSESAAGRVVAQDTYANLASSSTVDFSAMLARFNESTNRSNDDDDNDGMEENGGDKNGKQDDSKQVAPNEAQNNDDDQDDEVLMQTEERNRGAINVSLYLKLFEYAGGKWLVLAVVMLYALSECVTAFNTSFLGFWSESANANYTKVVPFDQLGNSLGIDLALPEDPDAIESWYIMWYAISGFLIIVSEIVPSVFMLILGQRASRNAYRALFDSVIRAPLSFFQTTPIGRILSRFANDTGDVDSHVPQMLIEASILTSSVVASLVVVSVIVPPFLIGLVVVSFIYVKIMKVYRPVNRDTKRIGALSRSPVYAHFSETLSGLPTIRAYGAAQRFNATNVRNIKMMVEDWIVGAQAMMWLDTRLGLINFIVTLVSSVLIMYSSLQGLVSPANAGVAITYTMLFTSKLSIAVMLFSFLEESMISFERVTYYIENIEHEAPATSSNPPPPSWPARGQIVLNDLKMRYRKDTPLVLHGLSLTIQAGERCAVVGRTGSGKSSLMLCLLRLVEPEYEQGSPAPIVIDGVDVCKIGLHELRSKISIVPQNPVVFSGTLRSNLDPTKEHADAVLWSALERCNLKPFVSGSASKLDMEISDSGSNLSQGQSQLLTLARSLLSNSKILLLDEATSSVDFDTDAIIQKTIRGEDAFGGCTVLTIAHRINTVIDSDKMLVLDQGKVAEFDSPEALLADPTSLFSSMVAEHRQE